MLSDKQVQTIEKRQAQAKTAATNKENEGKQLIDKRKSQYEAAKAEMNLNQGTIQKRQQQAQEITTSQEPEGQEPETQNPEKKQTKVFKKFMNKKTLLIAGGALVLIIVVIIIILKKKK